MLARFLGLVANPSPKQNQVTAALEAASKTLNLPVAKLQGLFENITSQSIGQRLLAVVQQDGGSTASELSDTVANITQQLKNLGLNPANILTRPGVISDVRGAIVAQLQSGSTDGIGNLLALYSGPPIRNDADICSLVRTVIGRGDNNWLDYHIYDDSAQYFVPEHGILRFAAQALPQGELPGLIASTASSMPTSTLNNLDDINEMMVRLGQGAFSEPQLAGLRSQQVLSHIADGNFRTAAKLRKQHGLFGDDAGQAKLRDAVTERVKKEPVSPVDLVKEQGETRPLDDLTGGYDQHVKTPEMQVSTLQGIRADWTQGRRSIPQGQISWIFETIMGSRNEDPRWFEECFRNTSETPVPPIFSGVIPTSWYTTGIEADLRTAPVQQAATDFLANWLPARRDDSRFVGYTEDITRCLRDIYGTNQLPDGGGRHFVTSCL